LTNTTKKFTGNCCGGLGGKSKKTEGKRERKLQKTERIQRPPTRKVGLKKNASKRRQGKRSQGKHPGGRIYFAEGDLGRKPRRG